MKFSRLLLFLALLSTHLLFGQKELKSMDKKELQELILNKELMLAEQQNLLTQQAIRLFEAESKVIQLQKELDSLTMDYNRLLEELETMSEPIASAPMIKEASDFWEIPKPSYDFLVQNEQLYRIFSPSSKTLGQVGERMARRLDDQGYGGHLSYFKIDGGFAIVTDVEQITNDGGTHADNVRWAAALASPRWFSLDFFRSLLFARQGYFRVMALTVSNKSLGINHRGLSLQEARHWEWLGGSAADFLNWDVAKRTFSDDYFSTILIYEFEVVENREPKISRVLGREIHLKNSGILKRIFNIEP